MSPQGHRIPGQRAHGGVLLVPCLLNDAYRYWLLADTGAALTMLTPQVAQEVGLEPDRPVRQQRIASVHRTALAPVLRLSSLQVGGQRAADLDVIVTDMAINLRLDGILGVNFLEQFRTTFEFDQSTLV